MEASSTGLLWAGRILSGIAIAFLLFDAAGKLMKVAPVVEGSAKLGFPESAVLPIGVLLLTGVVLYAIPRTSVFGAVYLAAYLGGAVASPVPPREPAGDPRAVPRLRRRVRVGWPRPPDAPAPGAPDERPLTGRP